MFLLGLTGGIGAGKTAAASILSELGIPVVDTDAIARDLVKPGEPALEEIRAAFGDSVLNPDRTLNRSHLAGMVFSDPIARVRLEQILHPRIRDRWQAAVKTWRDTGHQIGVVEIPLLFETAAESFFDLVACVACTAPTQQTRLAQRGWSASQIEGRLAAQWTMERKIASAHAVVWTEGQMSVHQTQWARLVSGWRDSFRKH